MKGFEKKTVETDAPTGARVSHYFSMCRPATGAGVCFYVSPGEKSLILLYPLLSKQKETSHTCELHTCGLGEVKKSMCFGIRHKMVTYIFDGRPKKLARENIACQPFLMVRLRLGAKNVLNK